MGDGIFVCRTEDRSGRDDGLMYKWANRAYVYTHARMQTTLFVEFFFYIRRNVKKEKKRGSSRY